MQRYTLCLALVLLATVAGAGDPVQDRLRVESFDPAQDVLRGYPFGKIELQRYQRSAATLHLAAPSPPPQGKPGACRRLTEAWNWASDSTLPESEKYRVFANLIRGMALKGCSCEIVSLPDAAGGPSALLEIRPLP
jgi:hypothetical protein